MSNGEDVLDNWEEIDEAGLTNTLQKIQAERHKVSSINKTSISDENFIRDNSSNISEINIEFDSTSNYSKDQTMKLLQRSTSSSSAGFCDPVDDKIENTLNDSPKSPLDDMSRTFQPVMMFLNKQNDEYQSANYTQPMQAVKILRRPTQNIDRRSNDPKPKAPVKTLQQREQEYAEARLRILGAAKNPEDDKNELITTALDACQPEIIISNNSGATSASNPAPPKKQSPINQTSAPTMVTPTTTATETETGARTGIAPTTTTTTTNTNTTSLQTSQTTQSPSGTKAPIPGNPGQETKKHIYMDMQTTFYEPIQNLLQPTNFFPLQPHFIPALPTHQILAFSNALNTNRISMPSLAAQTTHSPQANPTNHSTTVHSTIINPNQRNHYQKQLPHHTQQHNKPASWSPSRNIMRGQQQDNVLRLPRGPDGSVGFQMRR